MAGAEVGTYLRTDQNSCLQCFEIGPDRLHFYSRENREPPHIHVARDNSEAKFWLEPVSVANNYGFAATELNWIQRIVEEHCQELITAYIRFHGR